MRYTLTNETLAIEIDSFGAELKSVKSLADGREYMWYADKKYWGRTSPVLFPFVGSLKNKEYILDGRPYPMGQHGFARDMEFSLERQTEDTIWFSLCDNDETLEKFPFAFVLKIGYQLIGNAVKVLWEVINPDIPMVDGAAGPVYSILPFSIGAHPAFLCPKDGAEGENNKKGYSIAFGKFAEKTGNTTAHTFIDPHAETVPVSEMHHHGNSRVSGLSLTEDILLPLTDGKSEITAHYFDRCTYMFENNQANSVSLVDADGHTFVTVLFETPLFAIWSPEEKNAPFVCIEPWYGRCDHEDFAGELTEREYTNFLKSSDKFHAEYVMKFS